jgi:uncharacterized membrane protein
MTLVGMVIAVVFGNYLIFVLNIAEKGLYCLILWISSKFASENVK